MGSRGMLLLRIVMRLLRVFIFSVGERYRRCRRYRSCRRYKKMFIIVINIKIKMPITHFLINKSTILANIYT